MSENKQSIHVNELNDEALDNVAGGINRPAPAKEQCQHCGGWFSPSALYGSYCKPCLDELHKMGVYPPI